jgi:hypothetical protein
MITVFANSTFYTAMPNAGLIEGKSTLDHLRENYDVNGQWLNGVTVITVKNDLKEYLRERNRKNWIIINVGCVECYSHPAKNFLYWCCQYLNMYSCDSLFYSFVIPKMFIAAKDLNGKNNQFHQVLEVSEFTFIFDVILRLLEGFSVIVIGINKPNKQESNAHPHWIQQANDYKEAMERICVKYNNVVHIDSWNMLADYVVDSTHLNPEGHLKMFQEIERIIENE